MKNLFPVEKSFLSVVSQSCSQDENFVPVLLFRKRVVKMKHLFRGVASQQCGQDENDIRFRCVCPKIFNPKTFHIVPKHASNHDKNSIKRN